MANQGQGQRANQIKARANQGKSRQIKAIQGKTRGVIYYLL